MKTLFTTSREEQSKKLINTLSLIVARLERLDELTEEIQKLAVRHVDYGVIPKHYDYVGSALIWTLRQAFRQAWIPELEEAWVACYKDLANMMIEATKNQ